MNNFPYKGDWRVKEYRPYTEMLEEYVKTLEAENAELDASMEQLNSTIDELQARLSSQQEQMDMQTVSASLGSQAKGLAPSAVKNYADDWNKRSALYWP